MNYNNFHTIAARTEAAYSAAQSFIANQCPVLEQRLKVASLKAAVIILTVTLAVIDWAVERIARREEYRLRLTLTYVNTKRFAVRQLITVVKFDERYQLTAKASKAWARKGQIATAAMDKVFALN